MKKITTTASLLENVRAKTITTATILIIKTTSTTSSTTTLKPTAALAKVKDPIQFPITLPGQT